MEFRKTGGCTWQVKPNSPGNTLRIPNNTDFRIRFSGSDPYEFVYGICNDGAYRVTEGSARGEYPTASAAVNSVRRHIEQTNAYLYIEFKVGSYWKLADVLRYDERLSIPVDPLEEKAMELFREKIRKMAQDERAKLSPHEIEARAELAYVDNPKFVAKVRELFCSGE